MTKYETPGFDFDKVYGNPGDCKGEVTPVQPAGEAQFCDDTDPKNPRLSSTAP